MRKIVVILIAITIIILAAVGYYMISGRSPLGIPTPPTQRSETFHLSGKVMIKKRDAAEWEEAKRDIVVEDGDMISTIDRSTIEIKFGKERKNIIAAKENTTVVLKRIAKVGDKQIELREGNLLSFIEELDPKSAFEVRTPTAVCGVSGTGFETEAHENFSVVKVYEGEVHTRGIRIVSALPAKEVVVKEGTMTRIERYKPPEKPVPISDKDLEKWHHWKGDLDYHLFRTFYVFLDEGDKHNHYYPSGWVGDYDAIRRVIWKENPYSGKNCLRFRYTGRTPQGAGWAGVHWQNPVNNWGDIKGGYNLKGAKRLTFWARGEEGGENILHFGIGGVGGIYPDSTKVEIGPVVLEKEWKEYSIDLTGKDLSYISGGFFWMTDRASNPDGAAFYIDEIKYE